MIGWIAFSLAMSSNQPFSPNRKYEHPGEHLGRCLCNEAWPNNVTSKDQGITSSKTQGKMYLFDLYSYVCIYLYTRSCIHLWFMTYDYKFVHLETCVCVSRILRYQPSKKIVFCVNQNKGHWGSRCKYMKCCGKKVWRWGVEIMQKRWFVWPAWQ